MFVEWSYIIVLQIWFWSTIHLPWVKVLDTKQMAESVSHLGSPFSWSRLPQPIIIPSQAKTLLLWYILPVQCYHSGTVCKDPDLRYPGISLHCLHCRITPQICTRFVRWHFYRLAQAAAAGDHQCFCWWGEIASTPRQLVMFRFPQQWQHRHHNLTL